MGKPIAFVDVETTGLDPTIHEIWEVAVIEPGDEPCRLYDEKTHPEHVWVLRPDLASADSSALRISGYYDRRPVAMGHPLEVARDIARVLAGRHLVGAVPSFDAAFLERFLRRNGQAPAWHYHLIDVEALAVGYLHGRPANALTTDYDPLPVVTRLPWDSEAVSRAVGVDPKAFDRHTALGDARWARAIYEAVTR